MTETTLDARRTAEKAAWLRGYYAVRGAVSLAWVATALAVGPMSPVLSGVLLVGYPAWDALANIADARRTGGLRRNPTHLVNVLVSVVTTAAVGGALTLGMNAVLAVFGVWAVLSGLLLVATTVRRGRGSGAVVSGDQRRAIRGRGRHVPGRSGRPECSERRRHRALCRLRGALLPRVGGLAHRVAAALTVKSSRVCELVG